MNIGIAIVCRFNSSRFPGKILSKVQGNTVLENIVFRIKKHLPSFKVCIATSINESDDAIYDLCKAKNFNVFRGDLNDVSGRLLKCSIKNEWDYFVRINGDNIFVDFESLEVMTKQILDRDLDFITNVPSRTFPYGMSVEILKTSFYEQIYNSDKFSQDDKEHVTKWLYENLECNEYFEYKNMYYENIKGKMLALDTKKDLVLIKKILNFSNKTILDINLADIDNFFKVTDRIN